VTSGRIPRKDRSRTLGRRLSKEPARIIVIVLAMLKESSSRAQVSKQTSQLRGLGQDLNRPQPVSLIAALIREALKKSSPSGIVAVSNPSRVSQGRVIMSKQALSRVSGRNKVAAESSKAISNSSNLALVVVVMVVRGRVRRLMETQKVSLSRVKRDPARAKA
jgi:hypothetical protein